jgi:2-methylcitrate dehydratase PrpD
LFPGATTGCYRSRYSSHLLTTGATIFAERCILDTIGVIIAGGRSPLTDTVRRHALGACGPGRAVVLASGETVHPMAAAMVNGTAGHVY